MPKNKNKKKQNKEERLFQNLYKVISQFMFGKSYRPLNEAELSERLSILPEHREILRKVLQDFVKGKKFEISHGKYHRMTSSREIVKGIIRMNQRGFGFVQVSSIPDYGQDVFIPKVFTKNAVDGDLVEIVVEKENVSEKGPEGKVIAILERSRTHMAGIVNEIEPDGTLLAFVPLLGIEQRVVVHPHPDFTLQKGDRIVMEVVEWGSKETETVCKMSRYIGHISDPSFDIQAAIEEFELHADFSLEALAEAEKYGKTVSQKEIQQREDFRETVCVTIDPDTAKDFDDAISLSKDRKGHYHLGVHIADVSHYVRPNTALDKDALARCNSTYFPGFCLPMLPPSLSDNLCSLKPHVNRLTISVLMEFAPDGSIVSYRTSKSVIKSAKRFTYKEAKEILDGKKKSSFQPLLELMVELCLKLKQKRFERGSIEFAMPDLVVIVDEKGNPTKTDYISYDITHQMVEEFMLKANEIVATHLTEKGKNLAYRVHDIPAEENLKDFSLLVSAFGFTLPSKPKALELQILFEEAFKTSYGEYLASSFIRRMRLAAYSPQNIGHYGLALTHYCHFTSPIRRYVDLIAHRILFGESDNLQELEKIAAECSNQERISAKAEMRVVLLKKLRLLQNISKKEPHKQYEAVITRVKPYGFYFEIIELLLEGFLHVSELYHDFFDYEEKGMKLVGREHRTSYHAGEKILVSLRHVDLISLETHWHVVAEVDFLDTTAQFKKRTFKKSSPKKEKKSKRK